MLHRLIMGGWLVLVLVPCTGLALARCEPDKRQNRPVGQSSELQSLFEEDQADRRGGPGRIDWQKVTPKDEARRARAKEILAAGGAAAPEDFFRAAMLFQHGKDVEDFRKARQLALQAVELRPGYREARRLAAAALDRELTHSGKRQKYGTQYRSVDGRWELYEVDPSTTDDERERWGVPSLDKARRFAAEMNAER